MDDVCSVPPPCGRSQETAPVQRAEIRTRREQGVCAMELNGTSIWVIAMCFGAFMVGIYSWSRFDEPSYDSQSEYFARYKPRFSTSHARYARAKWAYLVAIILIYGGFTLVPELFSTLAGIQVSADNS